MGILNVTEDSFSDGSIYLDTDKALDQAKKLIDQGADIIDLGAESTRPGAYPVEANVEIERIIPLLSKLKQQHPDILYSIDTRKAEVAQAAIAAGADIINDISALRYDPNMAEVIAANPNIKLILMHMQGEPQTMQVAPHYTNVVSDVLEFFLQRLQFCRDMGINTTRLMLDPGIGFGKNLQHNLELLSHLASFKTFGLPIVLGASRKSFIHHVISSSPAERIAGSLAAAAFGMMQGVAILRVHDIAEHVQFMRVFSAIASAAGD